jgi:hypothetical protein
MKTEVAATSKINEPPCCGALGYKPRVGEPPPATKQKLSQHIMMIGVKLFAGSHTRKRGRPLYNR